MATSVGGSPFYSIGQSVTTVNRTCKMLLIVGLVTSIFAAIIIVLVFGSAIGLALSSGYSCIGSFMF